MITSEHDLYWLAGILEGEGCFSTAIYPEGYKLPRLWLLPLMCSRRAAKIKQILEECE